MCRKTWIACALACVISCSTFAIVTADAPDTLVQELNEDNWREMLKGEWMVEFYAPWCPACNALAPAWRELSLRADSLLGVHTAAVDVTKAAGLSGRFFITALPTIFHVKNGEFRQYSGARSSEDMLAWLREGRWRQVPALSAWKSPDSAHMSVLAWFFKLSQALRGVHTMLMETYGLPVWGSYLIFALATIFTGAILGLLLVCCVDAVMPPRSGAPHMEPAPLCGDDKPTEELISEDLVDDVEEADDAQSSSEETGGHHSSGEGNEVCGDGTGEVRKRRARKAE